MDDILLIKWLLIAAIILVGVVGLIGLYKDEVYWIEHGEDWYGLDHAKNKPMVLLDRTDWLSACLNI